MGESSRIRILVVIVVAFSLLLRILPTFSTGEPFSTDVWPLIRITRTLIQTNMPIFCDSTYGGYHNHWPATVLLASVVSGYTGLEPITVFRVVHEAVALVFGLLVYTIAKRREGKILAYIIASFTLPLLVFTSSLLKEGLGYVFFMLTVYLIMERRHWSLLVLALSLLILSHPLATVMLTAALIGVLIISILEGVERAEVKILGLGALFLITVGGTYNILYAAKPLGLEALMWSSNAALFLSYVLAVYGSFFLLRGSTRLYSLLFLAGISLASLVVFTGITPLGRAMPSTSYLYLFSVAAALAVYLLSRKKTIGTLFSYSLVLASITLLVYSFVGNPAYSWVSHRLVNYLILSSAIAAAHIMPRSRSHEAVVAGIGFAVALSAVLLAPSLYTGDDPLLFYWFYPKSFTTSMDFLISRINSGTNVIGDERVNYYAEYYGLRPNRLLELRLLQGQRVEGKYLLVLTPDNAKYGFPIALTLYNAREVIGKTKYMDKILDSSTVYAYCHYCST